MKRRHLAAAAALPVLLAIPAAAGAQTSSTVRLQPAKSAKAGTTLRVAVGASVPSSLRRSRTCVVRVAGVKGVNARVRLGVLGRNQVAKVKLPTTLAPKRYRITAVCSGITKRTVSVARVLPPSVGVTSKLVGGPILQGRLGTTAFAWAAEVSNPDTVLDAYSVTVTVTMTTPAGVQTIERQLIRRIPAGQTLTIGDNVVLAPGSVAPTSATVTAAAGFGLEKKNEPLPIVSPNPIQVNGTFDGGQITTAGVKGQVVSSLSRTVTRRSWVVFYDAADKVVGAIARPDAALPQGASEVKVDVTDLTVPQGVHHATVTYEG